MSVMRSAAVYRSLEGRTEPVGAMWTAAAMPLVSGSVPHVSRRHWPARWFLPAFVPLSGSLFLQPVFVSVCVRFPFS